MRALWIMIRWRSCPPLILLFPLRAVCLRCAAPRTAVNYGGVGAPGLASTTVFPTALIGATTWTVRTRSNKERAAGGHGRWRSLL